MIRISGQSSALLVEDTGKRAGGLSADGVVDTSGSVVVDMAPVEDRKPRKGGEGRGEERRGEG